MAERLSQSQLAKRLCLSTRQVHNLADEGMPSVSDGSKRWYEWESCFSWYVEYKQRQSAPADAEEAKARKLAAEARLAELELAAKEGTMVTVEDAAQAVEAKLEGLRSSLVTLPQRIAPVVLGCKTLAEVTAKLDAAVAEAMTSIAEGA